jgi:hypothetical protein
MNLDFWLVGFDYKNNVHTETVICSADDSPKNILDNFNWLMKSLGEKEYTDAKVLRKSDEFEQNKFYHLYDGWKRDCK